MEELLIFGILGFDIKVLFRLFVFIIVFDSGKTLSNEIFWLIKVTLHLLDVFQFLNVVIHTINRLSQLYPHTIIQNMDVNKTIRLQC